MIRFKCFAYGTQEVFRIMEVFKLSLGQILELFLFMLIGFILRRKRILSDETGALLSKLETLIFMPALIINSFVTNCNWTNLSSNLDLLLYSVGTIAASTLLAIPLSRLFSKEPLERSYYKYSLVIPNFGFVGNAIILGVLGSENLFKYLIFCIPINLFLYSIAIRWLTQRGSRKFTFRSLLNPIFISLIVGMVLGLLEVNLPTFLSATLSAASGCMAPIAMLVTGFIIGEYDLKKLFRIKKVYVLSILRLVVIPLLFYFVLKLFHVADNLLMIIIGYLAMPLGLYTILMPAANGDDTTTGASMALISNLLAVVTIPLVFMLVM